MKKIENNKRPSWWFSFQICNDWLWFQAILRLCRFLGLAVGLREWMPQPEALQRETCMNVYEYVQTVSEQKIQVEKVYNGVLWSYHSCSNQHFAGNICADPRTCPNIPPWTLRPANISTSGRHPPANSQAFIHQTFHLSVIKLNEAKTIERYIVSLLCGMALSRGSKMVVRHPQPPCERDKGRVILL